MPDIEIVNKQAIIPIYKSLRIRRFKNPGGYKDGLKLVNPMDVGIIFPFARSHEEMAKCVQTILGFQYMMKVKAYWIPRRFRIKEMIFTRKWIRYDNRNPIMMDTLFDNFKMLKSVFLRNLKKNYIFDYSTILNTLFPPFHEKEKWLINRYYQNAENLVIEWLSYILINPNISGNVIIPNTMAFGGGVLNTHNKILMGIKLSTKNASLAKYIDPSMMIPKILKRDVADYIPILMIRALAAGKMGYTEDPKLLELYKIIKDLSIVFYNERGIGFIYNTADDVLISKMDGLQAFSMLRGLTKIMISQNDPAAEELTDVDEDESEGSANSTMNNVAGIVDNKTPTNVDGVTDNNDLPINGVVGDISKIEDPELDEALSMLSNSKRVDKLSKDMFSVLLKASKKMDDDDDLDSVIEKDDEPSTEEGEEDTSDDEIELEESEEEEVEEEMISGETPLNPEDEVDDVKELIKGLARENKPTLTAAQVRRRALIKEKYKSIDIDGRTIEQIVTDTKATTIVNTIPRVTVKDESIKGSTLVDFEKSYLDNTMEYDIINTIKCFSGTDKSIGMHIVEATKLDTSDQLTHKHTYTFKLIDDKDKRHTIKVDIPKVDQDGFLMIGGNRKILKKQLTLLPVVKCKPDTVMISSNYNKCFIYRQGSVITRNVSILTKLLNKNLVDNPRFKIFFGDNSKENTSVITNIEYDILASKYHRFIIGNATGANSEYIFNQKEIREIIKEKIPTYVFKANKLPIGIDWKLRSVIDIDISNQADSVCNKIFDDIKKYDIIKDFENVISTIGIAKRRMYTRIEVQSRDYALVAFLGALYGLATIINTEKIKVQFTEKRLNGDNRVSIKFKDGYLYYDDMNTSASLLLNGLAYMNCEDYNYDDFNTERPYIDYFYELTKSRNVFKGHIAFKELFIDKITEEVLKDLGLPTDFLELFLYANTLLADNTYKSETSMENYRIRGFENISVILYKSIAAQYRLYKQSSTGTGRLSIQQDQVMVGLHKSFILENYDATNPTNELKSKSIVTFKGPGGINNDRVFTHEKRSMDLSAIGTIAISSTDSGSVGIIKQLTTNPNLTSTRGYVDICKSKNDAKNLDIGDIASPEEADVPFLNYHDDPKRIGVASSQTKHIVKVKGAKSLVISSGMDKCSAYMVGNTNVPKAKFDGVVKTIDNTHNIMIVEYANGTSESIPIGESVQRNSSFYFPNFILPNVNIGQKFKKGDILGYESEFYKKDIFGNIRSSQGVLSKLVLHESSVTDDDSSMITERLSDKMTTSVVKRKQITLSKDTNVLSFSKIGDYKLKGDSVLTFEDSGDEQTNELMATFGDVSEEVMAMARQTPKANATGHIIDMKVYFTVPLEELSDSLYKLVMDWFKAIKKKAKYEKENGVNNINTDILLRVTSPMKAGADLRINGAIIPNDGGVLIEYYIKHEQGMSVGDKLTFNANIKSVVAKVAAHGEEPITEDGIILDGIMGSMSLLARMCYSPFMSGCLGHVFVESSKQIAKEFLES